MKGIAAVIFATLFFATNSMAIETDQKRAELLSVAEQHYARKEFQKSVDVLTKFIESKPKTGIENAYYWRALCYKNLMKFKLVIPDLDMIIPKSVEAIKDKQFADPLATRCSAKLGIYTDEGEKDQALLLSAKKDCEAASRLDPNDVGIKGLTDTLYLIEAGEYDPLW